MMTVRWLLWRELGLAIVASIGLGMVLWGAQRSQIIRYNDPGASLPFALYVTIFLGLIAATVGVRLAIGTLTAYRTEHSDARGLPTWASWLLIALGIGLFLYSVMVMTGTVLEGRYADGNPNVPMLMFQQLVLTIAGVGGVLLLARPRADAGSRSSSRR